MKYTLYLPSTPLNILLSIAHAAAFQSEQQAKMVLIDQKQLENNRYYQSLKQAGEGLFTEVSILPGLAKGKAKLQEREQNFVLLKALLQEFSPDEIVVGSDRRVEFQQAMHFMSNTAKQTAGVYLDDGLYSYAGKPYSWFKEPINALLKKLAYGLWWQEPKTVGASAWIDQAWLFQPQYAVQAIQAKACHQIKTDWFALPEVQAISTEILGQYGIDVKAVQTLVEVDVFILFSHPNDIAQMPGYRQRVEAFIKQLTERNLKVAVKYHPRAQTEDDWGLAEQFELFLAPRDLAFEFMLPMLKPNSIVLGDVGTVVMTAKWLRPDIASYAVLNEDDDYASQFRGIMEKLQIPLISKFEDCIEQPE